MTRERQPEKKVVGFNILQDECIWMKSGIVSYKRCENAYDCNTCAYDKAMAAAIQSRKPSRGAPQPSFRDKSKAHDYMERQCRHMLTGRVAVRKCGNDFRCDVCEFDQLLDDADTIYPVGSVPIVEVAGYRYSDSYYYHLGHAWARVEYGGRVRVGIDDFALKLLGKPDGLDLPKIGKRISPEEPALALMRGGHTADVLPPLEGTVLAVNYEAREKPALTHADPYRTGWLFLVEPTRLKKGLETLLFGEQGKTWLEEECTRLHELVLGEYGAIAATGAQPVDDLFGQLPEIGWDTLVRSFLRTGRT